MFVSRGPRRATLSAAPCRAAAHGCGSGSDGEAEQASRPRYASTAPTATCRTPSSESSTRQAGLLNGMKGTTPLTPLSEELQEPPAQVNSKLVRLPLRRRVVRRGRDQRARGATGRFHRPAPIAQQISGVTNGGERCDAIAALPGLARIGTDIEYRGISINRGGFTDAGEPSTASYATLHFGNDEQLDDGKTEFLGAGDESAASAKRPPRPGSSRPVPTWPADGAPLTLGGLLPAHR